MKKYILLFSIFLSIPSLMAGACWSFAQDVVAQKEQMAAETYKLMGKDSPLIVLAEVRVR